MFLQIAVVHSSVTINMTSQQIGEAKLFSYQYYTRCILSVLTLFTVLSETRPVMHLPVEKYLTLQNNRQFGAITHDARIRNITPLLIRKIEPYMNY